jgi:hypothetical protein
MIKKDSIVEIDTDKVHISHINHWVGMGYLKEIIDTSKMSTLTKIKYYIRTKFTKQRRLKVLFGDDGSLQYVVKCRDCGTVIISYNDERFEERLDCPTCTDYKTDFKYFTNKEVGKDKGLKQYLRINMKIYNSWVKGE